MAPKRYLCSCCLASGTTAIDFYRVKHQLSFRDAVGHLQALLDQGALQENRRRHQKLWAIMAEAERFYQAMLWDDPDGRDARAYLAQEGISPETTRHFSLGFVPRSARTRLAPHLQACGFGPDDIVEAGLAYWDDQDALRAYARLRKTLALPVRDRDGHLWGFLHHEISGSSAPSFAHLRGMKALSENRWDGLVFAPPAPSQDGSGHLPMLIVPTLWDVVVLYQAGLTNAVWLGGAEDGQARRVRTLSVMAPRFTQIVPANRLDSSSRTACLNVMGGYLDRTDFLSLGNCQNVAEFLRSKGVGEFHSRMAHPLSVDDLMDI